MKLVLTLSFPLFPDQDLKRLVCQIISWPRESVGLAAAVVFTRSRGVSLVSQFLFFQLGYNGLIYFLMQRESNHANTAYLHLSLSLSRSVITATWFVFSLCTHEFQVIYLQSQQKSFLSRYGLLSVLEMRHVDLFEVVVF